MKRIYLITSLALLSVPALAGYSYHQLVSCLLKDNLCSVKKPTQGPIIDNGARPWFYPVNGKDFGTSVIGTPVTQSFLVANIGSGPLTVYGFDKGTIADPGMADALTGYTISPNSFRYTNSDCPTDGAFVLGPNATCTLNVKFSPEILGLQGDVLKLLHSSAEVGPVVQEVIGSGAPKPAIANPGSDGTPTTGGEVVSPKQPNSSVSPGEATAALQPSTDMLNFGTLPKDSVSPTLSYVLKNKGTGYLVLARKQINNGLFTFTDNCPVQLEAGASCTFNVQMKTSAVVLPASNDTLSIETKEGGTSSVKLTGVVAGAQVVAGPAPAEAIAYALDTAGEGTITLSNNGNVNASLSNFAISDTDLGAGGLEPGAKASSFTTIRQNDCHSLAPRKSCNVYLSVKNSTEVDTTGFLTFKADGITKAVPFRARVAAPDVQLSPSALGFGNVEYYSTKTTTVTAKNVGTKPIAIKRIPSVPYFAVSNNQCSALNVGETCTFDVTFTPTMGANPTKSATLTVYNDGDVEAVPLAVSASASGPVLSVSASSLNFENVQTGSAPTPQIVTLSNEGTSPLRVSGVSIDNNLFSLSRNTCSTLAAKATCELGVVLDTTKSGGGLTGKLTITSDSLSGATSTVALSARVNGAVPVIEQPVINFGEVQFDSTQVRQTRLLNKGDQPFKILNISANGQRMGFNSSCTKGMTLAVGGACDIAVVMNTSVSSRDGANIGVAVSTDAPAGTVSLTASGIATGPYLGGAVSLVNAPATKLGSAKTFSFGFVNSGYQPLNVTSAAVTAGQSDFKIVDNNCSNMGFNANCGITVEFKPTVFGPRTGQIDLTTNDPRYPTMSVALNGAGIDGDVAIYVDGAVARNFDFGLNNYGTTVSKSFVLKNEGGQAAKVLTMTGAGWGLTGCVGQTLAPAGTCTFSVNRTMPYKATLTPDSTSVGFTFDTAAPVSFTVSATPRGAWHSQSATVVDFGSQVYQTQTSQTVQFTNTGNQPLTFSGNWTFAGDTYNEFAVSDTSTCTSSVAAGASCNVVVTFTPKQAGNKAVTLSRGSNSLVTGTNGVMGFDIKAVGKVGNPEISFDNSAAPSGAVRNMYILNTGDSGITIQSMTASASNGSITLGSTANCVALVSKGYCSVPVTISGSSAVTATLTIKFTGGPGDDGKGTKVMNMVVNSAVTSLVTNAQLEPEGFYPTSTKWYKNPSTGATYALADGDLSTAVVTGQGAHNGFYPDRYGIVLNVERTKPASKVILYVENPNDYAVTVAAPFLGGTEYSGWIAGNFASASLAPKSKGYVTLALPLNYPADTFFRAGWFLVGYRYTGCGYCNWNYIYDALNIYEARVIQ